jgi:hypothetical protein
MARRAINAKVIMARCSKTKKAFGIRIEERGGDWVRTWAFPLDERKAKHEGYDANAVTGSMKAADDYPGCPHCGFGGFSHDSTGCGKVHCGGGGTNLGDCTELTCPWCGKTDRYVSAETMTVAGNGY